MSLRGEATGGGDSLAGAGGGALEGGRFERLLMPLERAIRQRETDGCGPACLEMALMLEDAGARPAARIAPSSLAAFSHGAERADESVPSMRWASSPDALRNALNAHGAAAAPAARRQQYHVVHAAAPSGPLEEILSWIRGPRTISGPLALPSFLLTRHGTHWMLAVGARVDDEGLVWLAAADPSSGRLLGLTPAGVLSVFTPNLVGAHPDWTGRHVAVIPSVLPRRWREAPGASADAAAPDAGLPPAPEALCPPEPIGVDIAAAVWSEAEAAPVLTRLSDFAERAHDPLAVRWLAPLRLARHLLDPDRASASQGSAGAGSPRRAWVVDGCLRPLAEVTLRGAPAVVLDFSVFPSVDKRPSASEP